MIRIEPDSNLAPIDGTLVYREADHAFDFEPRSQAEVEERVGDDGVTSLALGSLQLEVGVETGIVLYPWGYHPRVMWRQTTLPSVAARQGALRISVDNPLEAGVSLDITGGRQWTTLHDAVSAWVCIVRDTNLVAPPDLIKFSNGAIAGIDAGSLVVLWLHPMIA